VKITFKLDVFPFKLTTSKLSNFFQLTQNSEEPGIKTSVGLTEKCRIK
jgi:hypothetical protein